MPPARPTPDGGPPPLPLDATVPRDAGIDAAAEADAGSPFAPEGPPRSIYLMMVDRFADGAPSPIADDPCTDPANPRSFHGGDLVGLREHLDYLEELGVDAVWVTPLTRQIEPGGAECGYHGYWADLAVPDDRAIEPRLGTDEDLRALIDAMHGRGMRLILDMVVNHAGYDARITRSHPEWFHPVEGCERLGDPEETCPLSYLPDFDQSVPEAADYLVAHGLGWLEAFDVDGVRMDTVKHVPLGFFADRWFPAVRAARPELYVVGEVFDSGPYDTQRPYLDAGFDGLFDFRLRDALVGGLAQNGRLDEAAREVAAAWDALGPERARHRSLFVENHDVPRFASEIRASDDAEAARRLHLALAVILTTPGIPQLYAGGELGMAGFWPDNRRDFPEWGFDASARGPRDGYLGDPAVTFRLVRDLLALRRAAASLVDGDYIELWRPGGSGVPLYAFSRATETGRVIVTLSTGEVRADVPLRDNPGLDPRSREAWIDGPLTDLLGRDASARAEVVDGRLSLDLPAGAIAVWAAP
ncbi:MAG: alpha-amylase family glycosyl hydrolase [Sandaracinaceae bacterium]